MARVGSKQRLIRASAYGPSRSYAGHEASNVVATNPRTKNVSLPPLSTDNWNTVLLHGARPKHSPFKEEIFKNGDGLMIRTIDTEGARLIERIAIVCDAAHTSAIYVREWLDEVGEWGPVRKLHRKDICRRLLAEDLPKLPSSPH